MKLSSGRTKNLLFALVASAFVLWGANLCVELLEARNLIETVRLDDQVQFVDEELFVRIGNSWGTSDYGRRAMVPSRFRVEKGDAWRFFLLGGSFAMGTPYAHQAELQEGPGGIASWLRAGWFASVRPIEVINLGAGGQNSHRVRRIASTALGHDPDLILVATCNNEAALDPSVLREQLHRAGGYRLLREFLSADLEPEKRPHHAAPQLAPSALRDQFRDNLRELIGEAALKGTPVLLATLPVNLRYEGPKDERVAADGSGGRVDACVRLAVNEAEVRGIDIALDNIVRCGAGVSESLRWLGLELFEQGQYERATVALEFSVELEPLTRCRPSLNRIIREQAAAASHVELVDLDLAARRLSPGGLPGEELFVDSCHMSWRGYAHMAEEILRVASVAKLGPTSHLPQLQIEELGVRFGLVE